MNCGGRRHNVKVRRVRESGGKTIRCGGKDNVGGPVPGQLFWQLRRVVIYRLNLLNSFVARCRQHAPEYVGEKPRHVLVAGCPVAFKRHMANDDAR